MSLENLRNTLDKFPIKRDEDIRKIAYQIERLARKAPVLIQVSDGTEWVVPRGATKADIISRHSSERH
jgi:hypothetical protein